MILQSKERPSIKYLMPNEANSILFLPMDTKVEFGREDSVLEVALREDVAIAHSCGGMGTCGTCRIEIESPLNGLAPRNEIEKEMALDRGFGDTIRLACQLTPVAGLVVRVCLVLQDLDEVPID